MQRGIIAPHAAFAVVELRDRSDSGSPVGEWQHRVRSHPLSSDAAAVDATQSGMVADESALADGGAEAGATLPGS